MKGIFMKSRWALQDAKNKLSEVVKEAESHGPQLITRRGQDAAVLISVKDFKALTAQKGSLVDFLKASPLGELDLTRDKDTGRDLDL